MFSRLTLLFRLVTTVQNWWTYLAVRLGRAKGETATLMLRGGIALTIRAGTSDINVFNDIWLGGVYDIPGFRWGEAQTVIDIGAHIGVFTLLAATRNPQANIYAMEPEPSNAALLERNVAENGLASRVHIEAAGVAHKAGTLSLNVMPGRGECNSLYRQTEDSYAIIVPVTTLPAVFEKYAIGRCDLLKMNCEGAEYEIFYTLPTDLLKRIGTMVINYHFYSPDPTHHPKQLKSFLEEQGFSVRKTAKDIYVARRMPDHAGAGARSREVKI